MRKWKSLWLGFLLLVTLLGACETTVPPKSLTGMASPPVNLEAFEVTKNQVIALIHGNVLDGTGGPPHSDWTVLIQGSQIVAVGPDVIVPADAYVVDLTGKTALPGLIDMHGHLYANVGYSMSSQFKAFPRLYLAGGVTTIYSPGEFDPQGAIRLHDLIERGEEIGPRILSAGPYFNSGYISWMPNTFTVWGTLRQYRAWRDRINGVKVYTSIRDNQFAALVQAAHADGLLVTGHLESITAERAIELGINGIEHGAFSMSEFWPKGASREEKWCALGELDVNGTPAVTLVHALVQHHVYLDPTIVAYQPYLSDYEPVVADWEKYVAAGARDRVRNMLRTVTLKDDTCLRKALKSQAQLIKAVHDRGGLIVTGTDPVLPVNVPGYGLHRELQNLVHAGFTPLEAIQAATSNAAVVLELDSEIGTIAAGKTADLLIVEGDPTVDIKAIDNTILVFKDGIPYDPAALRKSVEGVIGTN